MLAFRLWVSKRRSIHTSKSTWTVDFIVDFIENWMNRDSNGFFRWIFNDLHGFFHVFPMDLDLHLRPMGIPGAGEVEKAGAAKPRQHLAPSPQDRWMKDMFFFGNVQQNPKIRCPILEYLSISRILGLTISYDHLSIFALIVLPKVISFLTAWSFIDFFLAVVFHFAPKSAAVKLGAPNRSQDILTFCYTSGTTGDPKGVLVTCGSPAQRALLNEKQQVSMLFHLWCCTRIY